MVDFIRAIIPLSDMGPSSMVPKKLHSKNPKMKHLCDVSDKKILGG